MDGIKVDMPAEYEVKAWRKYVTFTYEGKEYNVALLWDEYDGYEISKGWDELPDELKDNGGELCDTLDELTYLIDEEANA
jgi:hypothetical protein